MPKASFVVPVRDGAHFIENTVQSLLNQTEPDVEVVVVNDHSQDNTAEIIERLGQSDSRVILANMTDKAGVSAARNLGTSLAQSPVILPTDADDPNYPHRAELSLTELEHNKADIFYSNLMRHFVETGKEELRHFQPYDATLLRNINFIAHAGSSAYKKSVFEAVGGYDEQIKIGEDYDFWLCAQEKGFIFTSKNVACAQYTMHGGQTTGVATPEKTAERQAWNRTVRAKHGITSVDAEYVKQHATPEVVDFYVNKNYALWFSPESIPEN